MHSYGECTIEIDLTTWLSAVSSAVTDCSQQQSKILAIGVISDCVAHLQRMVRQTVNVMLNRALASRMQQE